FKDAKVQDELKLKKAQKDDIAALFTDFDKEVAKIQKEKGGFQKIGEMRKELTERVEGVLTKDQKQAFETMLGEKVNLFPGFGGGGGGGDKKPKKDDAE